MAAIPPLSHQRRKKPATYGKSSRNGNSWNVTTFDALEEFGKPRKVPASAKSSSGEVRTVNSEGASYGLKPVKARGEKTKHDIWDVPSSDDEPPSPIRVTSPPRFRVQREFVPDSKEPETKLAPWEEEQTARQPGPKSRPHANGTNRQSPKSNKQLHTGSPQSMTESGDTEQTPKASNNRKSRVPNVDQAVASTSAPALNAAARLHAKRSQATMSATAGGDDLLRLPSSSQAHVDLLADDLKSRPRKRVRGALLSTDEDNDIAMVNTPQHPQRESLRDDASGHGFPGTNVYNISASESEAHATHIVQPARRRIMRADPDRLQPSSKWRSREVGLANFKAPDDSDSPEATSRSPSIPGSGLVTPPPPNTAHSAPQPVETNGPGSPGEAQGAMTPKQADLWRQLLPTGSIRPSPSMLAMEQLNINSCERSDQTTSTVSHHTPRPRTYLSKQRARLVDRLKASAPDSDDEMSEHSEAESEQSMLSDAGPDDIDEPVATQQSQSQSQSQSQPTRADGGPRITYARDRSYLREESFEEGLMFQLSEDTPQKPTPATFARTNSKQASQKSAFDFDDSDEEGGPGRLRTVHELRAGGGNQRFMDDIGGLLDDISDHNISARSRRRTALMDIATKLSDRAYAEKFLRQGFERPLINECGSTPDDIADFTTTAAMATLMSSDLPEHAVQSLQDGEYLHFLVRLLPMTSDVRRLARDRRYNMSKSAQSSFTEFVDSLAERQSLWGDDKPARITPRLIALKSMEQVVQKLRRLGDRTELVGVSDIAQVWPPQDDQATEAAPSVGDALAISVLEALSTSTQALVWPSELVQRLGKHLTTLASAGEAARPTLFLTLRLCLNLTNGNVRNCHALSARSTVVSLMQAIRTGFAGLDTTGSGDEQRALRLDILLLSMGIMMNLAEHDDRAGEYASDPDEATTATILGELVAVCQQGQRRALEAESEAESAFNVAYGYLAVTLAQLCRYAGAKSVIASRLPGERLDVLVTAVEEFVEYHRDVDRLSSEGGQGMDVWSAFTEKLQGVLARLKTEAGLAMAR